MEPMVNGGHSRRELQSIGIWLTRTIADGSHGLCGLSQVIPSDTEGIFCVLFNVLIEGRPKIN
jgi:hypothetical protein